MEIYPQSAMLPWMLAAGMTSAQLGHLRSKNEGDFRRSPYLAVSYLSALLWMLCAVVFIGVYAWKVSGWAVLGLPMTAILGVVLCGIVEWFTGTVAIAVVSMFCWPVAMYFAFSGMPAAQT